MGRWLKRKTQRLFLIFGKTYRRMVFTFKFRVRKRRRRTKIPSLLPIKNFRKKTKRNKLNFSSRRLLLKTAVIETLQNINHYRKKLKKNL